MTAKIVRLNASALYALGMDRPTVEALINGLRITGNASDGITFPELAGTVDGNNQEFQQVKQQVILIQLTADFISSAPPVQQPDFSSLDAFSVTPPSIQTQQIEYLQTEVRQLAESLAQVTEFMQTEVRQIAEQQAATNNIIQELKQGTML